MAPDKVQLQYGGQRRGYLGRRFVVLGVCGVFGLTAFFAFVTYLQTDLRQRQADAAAWLDNRRSIKLSKLEITSAGKTRASTDPATLRFLERQVTLKNDPPGGGRYFKVQLRGSEDGRPCEVDLVMYLVTEGWGSWSITLDIPEVEFSAHAIRFSLTRERVPKELADLLDSL